MARCWWACARVTSWRCTPSGIRWADTAKQECEALARAVVAEAVSGGVSGRRPGVTRIDAGTPQCDADYDYFARPRAVRDAVAKVQNTGRIGKPLLTLHGTATPSVALERWVEDGARPPRDQRVSRTQGGDVVNACGLVSAPD